MMAVANNITKNWQWVVGAGAILISVGVNLSELRALKAKQTEQDGRYQRQFELINRLGDQIKALEAKEAYRKGREDERAKTTSTTTYSLTP